MDIRTLTTSFLLACVATSAAATQADAPPSALAVVRVAPEPFGREQRAIERVNLCADQLLARSLDAARQACESAVSAARKYAAPHYRATQKSDTLAAAWSNRAVAELLSGNAQAARKHMEHAVKAAPDATFVLRNRRYIEQLTGTSVVSR